MVRIFRQNTYKRHKSNNFNFEFLQFYFHRCVNIYVWNAFKMHCNHVLIIENICAYILNYIKVKYFYIFVCNLSEVFFFPQMHLTAERSYPTPLTSSPLLPLLLLSLARQRHSPDGTTRIKEEYDFIIGTIQFFNIYPIENT